VLPVFVLAALGLVWLLYEGAQPRAERVEPRGAPAVRPERGSGRGPGREPGGKPGTESPPAVAGTRVVPPVPAERLVVPLDAVQKGPGALILHVVDRESGDRVRCTVQLWRLDAPANARWTRGDQLQETRQAPNGDTRFEDLPAGRYRVFVEEERAGAPGEHAVEVGEGVTEERVEVLRARRWPILLRVIHDDGEHVERGKGGGAYCSRWEEVPASWPGMVRRARLDGGPTRSEPASGGLPQVLFLPGELASFDEGAGFSLGLAEENTKGKRYTQVFGLEPAGCVPVSFQLPDDLDGARLYGAPAVLLKAVLEAVRMPDGTPATDAGAQVEAKVGAIELRNEADEAGVWRLEVRLTARKAGYKPVDRTFPADRRPPTVYLEPAG